MDIPHQLGRVPSIVHVYLSFDADGRSAALSAGDLSRIESVTEEQVVIRNNTNESFFLRVVLQ